MHFILLDIKQAIKTLKLNNVIFNLNVCQMINKYISVISFKRYGPLSIINISEHLIDKKKKKKKKI